MLLKVERTPDVLFGQLKDRPNTVAIAMRGSPLDKITKVNIYMSKE